MVIDILQEQSFVPYTCLTMKKPQEILTRKNLINAFFVLLIVVLIVSPQAKALLIRGLINIGVMRAPTKSEKATPSTPPVNISLRQPDGSVLQTQQLHGKILIVNFWATWCPPCIAEMPSINQMYLHYKNNSNIAVLMVDADSDFSKSIPFMKKNGYSMPDYALAAGLPKGLISNAIPTTLIIDKNGRVVARHEGAANYSSEGFYNYIDTLLKQ